MPKSDDTVQRWGFSPPVGENIMESHVKKPSVSATSTSTSQPTTPSTPDSADDRRRAVEERRLLNELNQEVNGPGGTRGVLDPHHRGGSL